MAVTGRYISEQIRLQVTYVTAYSKCVLEDLLPAFGNMEERADKIADEEFNRLGEQPANEDFDGDMSDIAEQATAHGQAFFDTMVALQQPVRLDRKRGSGGMGSMMRVVDGVRGKIRSIWGRLYRWVEGEYISPKNEPGSPLVFLMGHWERPMITNFAIRLGEFWLEHWKWIIPTGIMLAAVIVNALKH